MPESPAPLSSVISLTASLLLPAVFAEAAPSLLTRQGFNPLDVDTPSPEDGPPASANALRDPTYLPAQIGGIVGAYAFSLILVAVALLSLSKKRREHINAGNDDVDFGEPKTPGFLRIVPPDEYLSQPPPLVVQNFSLPSPSKSAFELEPAPFIHSSPTSSISAPGVNPFVDPRIVAADKAMAQDQLEEMYKHVMEHEDAKQKGLVFDPPVYPTPGSSRPTSLDKAAPASLSKKERAKPASLNLTRTKEEKSSGSRTSSFLSALRSPKQKSVRGVSISSPLMTPQSATFPRHQDTSSMVSIPARQYAPAPPPPVPMDQLSIGTAKTRGSVPRLVPDPSPQSVQSIDERLGSQLDLRRTNNGGRVQSQASGEPDPESASSEHSQVPLVGLPASPKPGATFPALPASPKPGSSFSRPNAPSAVRTAGALPLRLYDPPMASPSAVPQTTKQTVFERKGPLSPMTARTPGTSMPYSPYQPFTPCVPITPSLVTKEERKRMRKMVPKTPTLEMVQSSDDVW